MPLPRSQPRLAPPPPAPLLQVPQIEHPHLAHTDHLSLFLYRGLLKSKLLVKTLPRCWHIQGSNGRGRNGLELLLGTANANKMGHNTHVLAYSRLYGEAFRVASHSSLAFWSLDLALLSSCLKNLILLLALSSSRWRESTDFLASSHSAVMSVEA